MYQIIDPIINVKQAWAELGQAQVRVVDEVYINVLVEFTTSPGGGWVGAGFYEINANLNSS